MKVRAIFSHRDEDSSHGTSGPNQWPPADELPDFRRKMETLFERYRDMNIELNRHICQLLGIEDHVLNDYFPQKTDFNSAIWHYFPLTPERLQEAKEGFVQGMHAHRDPSTFLTCLIQSRPGLQVQNHAGRWIDIPMVDGGVVRNVGEFFATLALTLRSSNLTLPLGSKVRNS